MQSAPVTSFSVKAGPTEPPSNFAHASSPPPPAFSIQQGPTSPPAHAVHASAPPPAQPLFELPAPTARKLRLSNSALVFIAFYLVAAAVLVIVLLARHTSGLAPTVTATDMQRQPLSIASVFVDGHEVCGALPCELPDTSGTHWVSIRATGYVAPEPVEVTGNVPVHFTLRRIGAAAPVAASSPAAATTPAATASAEPAPSAGEAAPATSSAPAAEETAAPQHVWHGPARLSFFSNPSSLVLLDGRPLGRTPRTGVTVSPGHHSVLFVRGSQRVARGTWATAGRTVGVSAHF